MLPLASSVPFFAVAIPFLDEMVALLLAAVAIAYVCYRLRLVPIAGFLIAGVVIGPSALGLVSERELVDALAEVGVVLLLFTIGIEFSLEKLGRLRQAIFVGGGIQVGAGIGVVTALVVMAGGSWTVGIYTGCLVALSSTAIVLGLLNERAETETTVGRLALAMLIFQDLAIVLMVLAIPVLAGEATEPADLAGVAGTAALLVGGVLVLARRLVPPLLAAVARTRRQELFLLTVVTICFGTAAVSAMAGVSLALGAFLAGLVVSESHYSELALSDILPLRVIFSAVFFVSVGMLLDLGFLVANLPLVLAAAAGVVLIKTLTVGAGVVALGYPIRISAVAGVTLAQIGEFSFVLERAGRDAGLSPAGLGEIGGQVFLAATVLLMVLTPFAVQAAPRIDRLLARGARPVRDEADANAPKLEDHVVLVGFGPAGRRVARVLGEAGIPFAVIDFNPAAVDELRREGGAAIFGDASRPHILESAGMERAKLMVVVIHDAGATRRIVQVGRHLNPTAQIVVRTRFLHEIESLQRIGADVVIPEEMETTVRIFAQVLGAYMVPSAEINRYVNELRAADYGILRGSIQEAHLMVLQGLDEEGLHTRAVAVRPGCPAAGKSLAELALRRDHELSVLSVRRGDRNLGNPAGDFVVQADDRLLLVGSAERFAGAAWLFRTPAEAPRLE